MQLAESSTNRPMLQRMCKDMCSRMVVGVYFAFVSPWKLRIVCNACRDSKDPLTIVFVDALPLFKERSPLLSSNHQTLFLPPKKEDDDLFHEENSRRVVDG